MSHENAPNITQATKFNQLVDQVDETAKMAKLADNVTGQNYSFREQMGYDDRETGDYITQVDLGERKNAVVRDRVTLVNKEGKPDSIMAETGEDISPVFRDIHPDDRRYKNLHSKTIDFLGMPEMGMQRVATANIGAPEHGRTVSRSRLEVDGWRRDKNGEWKKVNKELTSSNPFVARLIAAIALKQIREQSAGRVNAERLKHYDRWTETAKQANKDRSLKDKVTGENKVDREDIMRAEAEADNVQFDQEKQNNKLKAA